MVFWDSGLFDEIIKSSYYVVTDPDIVPIEQCPKDYVEFFYNILNQYPLITKVGFSLKIDDLPVVNEHRMDIVRWESFFYDNVISYDPLLYKANIDTTFALYRPGMWKDFFSAIRTGFPYVARHLPWYIETANMTVQEKEYLIKGKKFGNSFVDTEKLVGLNYGMIRKIYQKLEPNLVVEKKKIYEEFVKLHKKVYIYGAGKIGRKVGFFLQENNIRFDGYVVTKITDEKKCLDFDILEITDIMGNKNDVGIILAVAINNQMQLLSEIYQQGIKSVCSIEL